MPDGTKTLIREIIEIGFAGEIVLQLALNAFLLQRLFLREGDILQVIYTWVYRGHQDAGLSICR